MVAAVIHDEIWLVGQKTTEVWDDVGAPDFPFQKLAGIFIQHGCAARYSVAQADLSLFWLGLDPQGQCIVFRGAEYSAQRISTHAIEQVLQSYSTVADAQGFTYQIKGHVFYVLTFPTADATWVFDMASGLWHEWVWTDDNGGEHWSRANVAAFAYGTNVCGDWQNGALYKLDPLAFTDAGQPIVRRRGFPQLVNEGKRLSYSRFVAEMDVGQNAGLQSYVSLRYSDTKGASWGLPIQIPIGGFGEFLTSMQARQLGMGRDRVFELFWSLPSKTALNGAYVDAELCET